ncbi:hypothetical protein [Nonomuraea sp. NPDC003804]
MTIRMRATLPTLGCCDDQGARDIADPGGIVTIKVPVTLPTLEEP